MTSAPDLNEIREVRETAEILCTVDVIEAAIERIAGMISERFADSNPLCLCMMNGGLIFTGKLLSLLDFPLQQDYIHASRYRGNTRGSSDLNWIKFPDIPVRERTVLLIDDVLDEGITLQKVLGYCRDNGAAEIFSVVLADKLGARKAEGLQQADFTALEIPNRYVFGYGLDYKSYLRNAPGIFAVRGL